MLATFNGQRFLGEQLDSLAGQDHPSIDVWLSDDSSSDDTLAIARQAAKGWSKGNFEIIQRNVAPIAAGTNGIDLEQALARSNGNFLSLMLNGSINAEYYAFCDQDDVWESSKLSRAVAWLEQQPEGVPAMHCSRTRIIDEAGRLHGLSILFSKTPGFRNAIIQNIAAGNTIVMNRAAMLELRKHTIAGQFVSHDWWVYILVTALGGKVKYDEEPLTRYRQHGANLVGENASWRARMVRFKLVLTGRFRQWNDVNLAALRKISHLLPAENRRILDEFCALRQGVSLLRPLRILRTGIFRQTFAGQLSFLAASLMGKI